MKAEDYLKEYRIYNDEIIYNSVGDMVGTLSQLMNDYHESEVKKLNIPDVSNRRELLIAVFKTVKGITIPETDEQIEKFVEQYSN